MLFAPTVVLAALAVYLPGAALLWHTRLAPLTKAALAAPLGVLGLSGTSWLVSAVGLPWSPWWLLGTTALCAILGRFMRGIGWSETELDRTYGLGILIGTAVMLLPVLLALHSPTALAQTYDNVFHLNATQYVASSGDAGPGALRAIQAGAFYPTAWYAWAAVLVQAGVSVPAAVQAITLVTLFAIWPTGIALLVRTTVGPGVPGRLAAGALAFGSVSFPFTLLTWGSLYPNLLGFSLLPGLTGLGWALLREEAPAWGRLGLTAAAAAGTGLAHPNALLGLGLLLWLPVVFTLLRRGPARWWAVMLGLAAVAFPFAWWRVGSTLVDVERDAFLSVPHALAEVALGSSLGKPPMLLTSLGVLVGVVVLARAAERRAWLVPVAVLGAVYVVNASSDNDALVRVVSAPLFSDPHRSAALLAIASIPVAVAGWDWLLRRVLDSLGRRAPAPRTFAAAAAGLVAALNLATPGWWDTHARLDRTFASGTDSDVLTPDERALIERIPEHTRARVVVDPWHGGSLVYALTGLEVTQYYPSALTDDAELVNARLRDGGADVCAALERLGADHVLELEPHIIPSVREVPENRGIRNLEGTEGLTEVDRVGDAVLYRIDVCD